MNKKVEIDLNRIVSKISITGIFVVMSLHFMFAGTIDSLHCNRFPYYKINHVVYNNGIFLANGAVVEEKEKWDNMNNKIESLFYMYSINDSTWDWCKPLGMNINKTEDTVIYEAFPRNILAFKGYFIAIIEVGDNPERTQRIHYSKDGIHWISTGIHVTSLHIVNDKIIAESDLSIAVSDNGVFWNIYAYKNWDNSYPQYRNIVPVENQTIDFISFPDTIHDENYDWEVYPYISYDWSALKAYYRDDNYILTDTSSFIALSPDAVKWNFVETPTKGDSNLCLQYAYGKIQYIENSNGAFFKNSSSDGGKSWNRTKIVIDSSYFENGFTFENAVFIDTTLYVQVTTFYGNEDEGFHFYNIDLISDDGINFKPDNLHDVEYNVMQYTKPAVIQLKSLTEINFQFKDLYHGKLIPLNMQ